MLLLLVPPGLLLAGILAVPGHRPLGLPRAAEIIRTGAERGDLILFAGLAPQDVARELAGLAFLPLPAARRMTLEGFDRIWLLEAHPTGPHVLPPARETYDLSGLSLSLHLLPRHALLERLESAVVDFLPDFPRGALAASCPARKPALFQCAVRPWVQVRRHEERGQGALLPCIAASPAAGGTLRIRFPRMPVGDLLQFRSTLAEPTTANRAVHVDLRIDGQTVLHFSQRGTARWEDREADTRSRRGPMREIEVRLRTDQETKLHFCFTGGTR
jgi:hypothetical protein